MSGKSILALHFSDTHLGLRQYGLEERERDFYDSFREAIEIALREHVDLVIHTGDFFDSYRPPPQSILVAIRALQRLRNKNIPIVSILGEHDTPKRRMYPPPLLLEELGLLRVLGYNPLNIQNYSTIIRTKSGEVFVAGVSNHRGIEVDVLPRRIRFVENPPDNIPSILMLHQVLEEFFPMGGDIKVVALPKGYSYYAMGHLHSYGRMELGETLVAYSGSTEIVRMDEVDKGEKRVLLVEITVNRSTLIDAVKLETVRPQYIVNIPYKDLKKSLSVIAGKIGASKKKPVIHISIKEIPSHVKRHTIYAILDMILKDRVLSYRIINLETEKKEEQVTIEDVKKGLNIVDLLETILGEKDLASLALKLIELLGYGGSQADIIEAKSVVRKYGKEKYGV